MMFVSNIRTVFLKKSNPLRVLFPYHDTNKHRDTGIVPAVINASAEQSRRRNPVRREMNVHGTEEMHSINNKTQAAGLLQSPRHLFK